ncbi:MAG: hypothetical protein ACI88H_004207 [Cocleimonas sp.]|jgi:hypothetical protein
MKNTTLTMIVIISLSLISGASVAESRSGTHRSDNEFLNRNLPQRNQINLSQDQTMSPTEPSQFSQQKIHERKEKDSVEKNNEQRNADGFNDNRDNRATRR